MCVLIIPEQELRAIPVRYIRRIISRPTSECYFLRINLILMGNNRRSVTVENIIIRNNLSTYGIVSSLIDRSIDRVRICQNLNNTLCFIDTVDRCLRSLSLTVVYERFFAPGHLKLLLDYDLEGKLCYCIVLIIKMFLIFVGNLYILLAKLCTFKGEHIRRNIDFFCRDIFILIFEVLYKLKAGKIQILGVDCLLIYSDDVHLLLIICCIKRYTLNNISDVKLFRNLCILGKGIVMIILVTACNMVNDTGGLCMMCIVLRFITVATALSFDHNYTAVYFFALNHLSYRNMFRIIEFKFGNCPTDVYRLLLDSKLCTHC